MAHQKKKEFAKFASVGLVSTAVDYTLLNVFAVLIGIPLLLANSISAPFSSFVSYKLNKHVVFEDRMHGRRKTLLLYVAILGVGILIIQNSLLHILNRTIAPEVAALIKPTLESFKIGGLSIDTIAINASKIGASAIAALWNYFMLRRYVFVTSDD